MASVSFSVRDVIAYKLDEYQKKHKLESRTQAIDHLLKGSKKPYSEIPD